ncbi:hypothetical protein V5O48_016148, partial [Marasmius crinis-equi]
MLQFQREAPTADEPIPAQATRITVTASASQAAQNQRAGLGRLNGLTSFLDGIDPNASSFTSTSSVSSQAPDDERVVVEELKRFRDEPIIEDGSATMNDFDLLRWWQLDRSKYPLLYKIAMDVLPIQESAVPCERIFSSSKETDTDRCNRLKPETFERLQIMKFIYRRNRLDFTQGLGITVEDSEGTEGQE